MIELPVLTDVKQHTARIALVGNPNAGKTTLFNALSGLRARTANFPGITVDVRTAPLPLGDLTADLVDLPGLYSLDALSPEEQVAEAVLRGQGLITQPPEVVLLVLDATNLERNLFLASEILDLNLPTVVALTLVDAADASGVSLDLDHLTSRLNCPVVPVSARTGAGLTELREMLRELLSRPNLVGTEAGESCIAGCGGCPFSARYEWASTIAAASVSRPADHGRKVTMIDRVLTNPFMGIVALLAVMLGAFYLIFSLADIPMTLIDEGFSLVASFVDDLIPATSTRGPLWSGGVFAVAMMIFTIGYRINRVRWSPRNTLLAVGLSVVVSQLPLDDVRSLLIDGIIAGVGGVVIFLPQICILFFLISLLEDSGYMARAAFVMERLMRSVGLPGKAFVPMLSAHACAIPGIMAARVIENSRDRLVTILVLPLFTCSARLPVYAMVAALLFADSPGKAALVFVGAYTLGIAAALLSAWVLKHTILRGDAEPLVLELPPYRLPSLRNALMTVFDRATVFLRNAGTIILLISVILWGMATYPRLSEDNLPPAVAADVASLRSQAELTSDEPAAELFARADRLVAQERLAHSAAGRFGHLVEPIFRPLGFDWKINVGVISSFAAREVVVSTLAILYGIGDDPGEEPSTLVDTLQRQQRADGTPVYTTATSLSLLVFYVLAMQCLPTQAVTRRETGTWKWALFQFGYMTVLAYAASLIVYQIAGALGLA